jgi:hypothetical protein
MKKILRVWSARWVTWFLMVVILCFACQAHAIDIHLRWNPNIEPDLSGYKIYYKKASPGPPYNGSAALEGDSPIIVHAHQVLVGNICEFTLSDLDGTQVYYFAVTAYDREGNESDYSNEVCLNCKSEYECNLTPNTFVIQRGEKLGIDVTVTNTADQAGMVYFATQVTKANGEMSGYAYGAVPVYLGPYGSKQGHISHTVPMDWPLGYNVYRGYLGIPGVGTLHICQFEFEVVPRR